MHGAIGCHLLSWANPFTSTWFFVCMHVSLIFRSLLLVFRKGSYCTRILNCNGYTTCMSVVHVSIRVELSFGLKSFVCKMLG